MKNFLINQSAWLIPSLIALLLTPWISTWDLDFSRLFFQNGSFDNSNWVQFIYDYGMLPAQIFTVFTFLVFILSFFVPLFRKWQFPALVLTLIMIIGPGLIINVGFKDHWGRPRPRQIEEFGGKQPFRPFYSPQFSAPEPSKSFPCGHCAMGFFFLAPAYLCYKKRKVAWMAAWIGIALLLGGFLSWGRIAQGGHFLSDILFSTLIVWITTWICYKVVSSYVTVD